MPPQVYVHIYASTWRAATGLRTGSQAIVQDTAMPSLCATVLIGVNVCGYTPVLVPVLPLLP